MIPLVLRDPQSIVAYDGTVAITASAFVQNAISISQRLPEHGYAINLCRDRLTFFYALIAVIARGQCNLLPPNGQNGTVEDLIAQYPDCYLLHDGYPHPIHSAPSIDIRKLRTSESQNASQNASQNTYQGAPQNEIDDAIDPVIPSVPMIHDDHVAAISFTSGSTGQSRPNLKTWSMLIEGAHVNASNMLLDVSPGLNILATVPAQHMYGLELSITLPLVADVHMHSGQPLYPNDILEALERVNAPRALVSTPQHLRALVSSNLAFPKLERIYSATAPLDQALAQQVEACFAGELVEIYGCSEIGSIARRRSAKQQYWTPFSAMTFVTTDESTTVSAAHVPETVELQDHIEQNPDGSFNLKGRFGDLVNIAGKRGSLAQFNQLLMSIPGVVDGIIFQPPDANPDATQDAYKGARLAAIVVSGGATKNSILTALREHVDPVFLPRPILFADALPRTETSKLPRQSVLDFFQQLKNRSTRN